MTGNLNVCVCVCVVLFVVHAKAERIGLICPSDTTVANSCVDWYIVMKGVLNLMTGS